MAPPKPQHGVVTANVAYCCGVALYTRPSCRVAIKAGVVSPNDFYSFFVPDLVVTCAPSDLTGDWVASPSLIIEILSPSTRDHDSRVKLMAYRAIPGVTEIMLIDPHEPWCEIHRRLHRAARPVLRRIGHGVRGPPCSKPGGRINSPGQTVGWPPSSYGETRRGRKVRAPRKHGAG
jgi:Uma2 family endonuclease